ncbi:MAG: hypothetical protein ACKV2U_03635 [Bryobacteraceae bacterium]
MSLQTWQETLVTSQVAGTLFNTYTTTKTVLPVGCLVTLPANWWYIGRTIRVTVQGGMSTLVTTPGTCTMSVNLGAITAFTTGAVQLNATAHTTIPFELSVLLTCRAVGSGTAANCMGIGKLRGRMFTYTAAQVDQVNIGDSMMVPTTAPAVGSGFDSTAAQTLDFFNGFSISNAANGIQVQNYIVEALN